jgi:adenylyl cyclase-associated protein
VLVLTTKAKKPDKQSSTYMDCFTELTTAMGAVTDIKEANRASPFFNHLSCVSEGVSVVVWVTVDPKPANYVKESLPSAQFYGNRVLKDYRNTDKP